MEKEKKYKCQCLCGCRKEFEPYIAGILFKRFEKEVCPDCDDSSHKPYESKIGEINGNPAFV